MTPTPSYPRKKRDVTHEDYNSALFSPGDMLIGSAKGSRLPSPCETPAIVPSPFGSNRPLEAGSGRALVDSLD